MIMFSCCLALNIRWKIIYSLFKSYPFIMMNSHPSCLRCLRLRWVLIFYSCSLIIAIIISVITSIICKFIDGILCTLWCWCIDTLRYFVSTILGVSSSFIIIPIMSYYRPVIIILKHCFYKYEQCYM